MVGWQTDNEESTSLRFTGSALCAALHALRVTAEPREPVRLYVCN